MMMFDDYSATLPLIIVVVFETFSVSWLYGADRCGLFFSSSIFSTGNIKMLNPMQMSTNQFSSVLPVFVTNIYHS